MTHTLCVMPRRASQHCLDNHRNPDGSLRRRDGQGHCLDCRAAANAARRARRKARIDSLKLEAGCGRCGFDAHPDALHFHHRNPGEKDMSVSQMRLMSDDRLNAEIAKCEVICANCHAEHHARARD